MKNKANITVYGGTYDGRRRMIVAAPTKKAAYEAIKKVLNVGCYASWNNYTSDTGNYEECKTAIAEPLTVFSRDDRFGNRKPFEKLLR